MAEPIKRGSHWWTQAPDGAWLRWNAAEHRWDPHAGGPPREDAETRAPEAEPLAGSGGAPTEPTFDSTALGRRLRDYDSAEGKGKAASLLLGLTSLAALVFGLWSLQRALSGSALFVDSPGLTALSTGLFFSFIATAVMVIVWFKAAYENAGALGATDLRFSPGWTIGGWLLPIANLFIPKKIADDIWRASDPALPVQAGDGWKLQWVPSRLHVWWTFWVVQLIGSRVADRLVAQALADRDASAYRFGVGLQGASAIFLAFAGLVLIRIVADVTARQNERERQARSLLEGPVPAA